MTDYRLYFLDRQGKILSAEWIAADSDEDAVSRVQALDKGAVCELWQRDRFVASVARDAAADRGIAPGDGGRAPRPR